MTLEEAIKHAEEVAEENQRVVDTGIVFDDVTIDMLYCDDTEVIEEHLANYQRCADRHRQLAEWLTDYKRLLEQEPCEDWYDLPSDEMTLEQARQAVKDLRKKLSEHLEQEPQTMHWQKHTDASGNSWHACPACGRVAYTLTRFCPDCGMRLEAPS